MKISATVIGLVVIIAALALLFAYPIVWLINYLFAPSLLFAVFGVSKIGFWKALALNAFFGFFVKSQSTSNSK